MSAARILNDLIEQNQCDVEYKHLEDNQESKYTSKTTWEDMPYDLKITMGQYLLKEEISTQEDNGERIVRTFINNDTSEADATKLLGNRQNLDLPFPDRKDESFFKYTPTVYNLLLRNICDYNFEYPGENGWVTDCLNQSTRPQNCGGGTCLVFCVFLPVSLAVTITSTPFGLFADCARSAKRNCDDYQDKRLCEELVGPPSQTMS